jgi:acetyl-CoA acetyltransferase family protein
MTAARRAVIVDVVRSAFGRGREGGLLHGLHPVDLYAQVLEALVRRTGVDPALIEDVITGCVIQVGEQSGNIGRHAALAAGLPESVAAVTLDRKCGSAQQAVDFAAQGVIAGAYDVVIAGGVEMMSTVPMRANRLGKDTDGERLKRRYPDGFIRQGLSAELIAARWGLSRNDQDAFALRSHQRAALGEDEGVTTAAVVPVKVPGRNEAATRDEGLRRDSTLEKLSKLKPAFEDPEARLAHPQVQWSVTAGNASQITDGAGAALIVEERVAQRLNLRPLAAVSRFAVCGDDPILMLTAIIPATRRLLSRAGMRLDQIDAYEVNEAFASVPLAWAKELGADPERLNVYGGAIALGHPVGASGMRLLANLIAALQRRKGRWGLQTMCESGGMANATLIENLG